MDWRRALTFTVAALAFAGTIWLATWADRPIEAGPHALIVEGPDGIIWNGTADGATPLDVLLDAADGAFEVKLTGSGAGAYVEGIAGYTEGPGGWCFLVATADGREVPSVGAGAFGLEPGQAIWWSWTDTRCEDL